MVVRIVGYISMIGIVAAGLAQWWPIPPAPSTSKIVFTIPILIASMIFPLLAHGINAIVKMIDEIIQSDQPVNAKIKGIKTLGILGFGMIGQAATAGAKLSAEARKP